MGPVSAVFADARHTLRSWRRSRKVSVDLSLEQPLSLPPLALLCGAYLRLCGGQGGERGQRMRRGGGGARGLSPVPRLRPEQGSRGAEGREPSRGWGCRAAW